MISIHMYDGSRRVNSTGDYSVDSSAILCAGRKSAGGQDFCEGDEGNGLFVMEEQR